MNEHDRSQELDFTPIEGEQGVPVGFKVLLWGLVAFGAYYLWAYSPWSSGWSQAGELDGAGQAAGAGVNIFATILFTAVAVLAAVVILFALARRKKAP